MKGREKAWNAKITEDDVREIRRFREMGHTYSEVIEITGISKASVTKVLGGKTWTHVK